MTERPAIVRINESSDGERANVVITLSWHDAEYAGEADGAADWSYRPRLIGEATLRAVEQVTGNRIQLSLAAVATSPLGKGLVAMAQVEMEGQPQPLVGSALLDETDEAAATVKAVLDAINRRLSQMD